MAHLSLAVGSGAGALRNWLDSPALSASCAQRPRQAIARAKRRLPASRLGIPLALPSLSQSDSEVRDASETHELSFIEGNRRGYNFGCRPVVGVGLRGRQGDFP